jgi:hypothetical protein
MQLVEAEAHKVEVEVLKVALAELEEQVVVTELEI